MQIGYNLGPKMNKACYALERATENLVRQIIPDATIKPFPSGYTDEYFDAFLCIGGDSPSYWQTIEGNVVRNALKMGVPTFGLGLDISPRLGRYTGIPPMMIRYLSMFEGILVRSAGSQKLLERYGIPSDIIPDIAWSLDAAPIDYDVPENTIAICAYQEIQDLEKLIKALVWELKTQGYNVIQIRECEIHIRMEDLSCTPLKATWQQQISILKKCKALITTGFHAAISGYKAGIPVMTLPVQEKTYWLAEELGLPKPNPFSAIQSPRYICNELQKLIENPPTIKIPTHEKTIEKLRGLFHEYVPGFSDN